jgi:glycosyltransferase involved in cell wall biosynthesis
VTSPTRNQSLPVSVVILTYNEEANLPACLESLRGLECEVFVVDSGSSDATREIARAFGAQVFEHPFESHAQQWNWALQNLPIATDWVLGLDADQRLTSELGQELIELFTVNSDGLDAIDGFYIKRRQIFRGRWIRHGGYYPKYLLKLFRRDRVSVDCHDMVDHHFWVNGATARLKHDLIEDNQKEADLAFWIEKHNRYAVLHAQEEWARRNGLKWPVQPSLFGNPDQRVAWLKQCWYHLPLYVRPFLYFFYRYFLRLGFLDGKQGFIFHFLQGFWYRLLIDIKIDELRRSQAESKRGKARGENVS